LHYHRSSTVYHKQITRETVQHYHGVLKRPASVCFHLSVWPVTGRFADKQQTSSPTRYFAHNMRDECTDLSTMLRYYYLVSESSCQRNYWSANWFVSETSRIDWSIE